MNDIIKYDMSKSLDPRRFAVGDWVTAVKLVMRLRKYHTGEVTVAIKPFAKPVTGVIVGIKILWEGKVEGHYMYEDGWSQAEWNPSNPVKVWMIRQGLMNKPVYALDCFVQPAEPGVLPIKWCNPVAWTDKQKQDLSEESRRWVRDSNGRWTGQLKG